MTNEEQRMTELADAQFIGFAYAKSGYEITTLVESMGLEKSEWDSLKDKTYLSELDKQEVDEYFNNQIN